MSSLLTYIFNNSFGVVFFFCNRRAVIFCCFQQVMFQEFVVQMLRRFRADFPYLRDSLTFVIISRCAALVGLHLNVLELFVRVRIHFIDGVVLAFVKSPGQLDIIACSLVYSNWLLLQNSSLPDEESRDVVAPHLTVVVAQDTERVLRSLSCLLCSALKSNRDGPDVQQ